VRTLLLIDLGLRIHVKSKNDHIGREVYATDKEEDIRVVKRNLLRQLHHHKDDGQVSSAEIKAWSVLFDLCQRKIIMEKGTRLTLEDSPF
jgi:hypothetical protein